MAAPAARRPPYLGVGLVVLGLFAVFLHVSYFSRRLTRDSSLASIRAGEVPLGQAIRIPQAWLSQNPLRAPELDAHAKGSDRAYRYMVAHDEKTGARLPVLLFRTTFLESRAEGNFFITEVRGTLRETPAKERDRLLRELPQELATSHDASVYLDEMSFDSVSVAVCFTALLSMAAVLGGLLSLLSSLRPGTVSFPVAVAPAPKRAEPVRVPAKVEKMRTCEACGTESPLSSRSCSSCKLPVEVEYYVAATLPFEGFDRFVPTLTTILQTNEYQATQPLARVHTPVPYQHLDGFHVRGSASSSPYRLASRGIASLVTARALAAALVEKGVEALVVGSDELQKSPPPRRASGLTFDDEAVTFVFENGPDREERRIAWRSVVLLLFSAASPLRGTMTIAKELKEGAPVDPSSYLVDLFERGNPEAVRISIQSFWHWEALKLAGSERPADRFGKLMELLESRARDAEIQYVTGLYRGPKSEWRMNYYSRFAWLVGEKSAWAKTDGPPRLDGYEVLEKLGEGGMGAVYRGRQKKLGRMVALKVIASHLAAEKKFVQRFEAEARAVATLLHPNIVQVIDLAESSGRHFIVMELVEGKTLLRILRERGRVSEADALRIGLQVASALEHASERGILHRDVKPENIFVGASGVAKLGDWGLAKDMDQDLGLTDTGTAIGTPYYMSPEQARARKDLDVRSDFYSLGASLFHAIAGVPPFRGSSPVEVITKHLSAPIPDIRTIVPQVSPPTAELLRRLLAKKKEDRIQSGHLLTTELEGVLRELEGVAV